MAVLQVDLPSQQPLLLQALADLFRAPTHRTRHSKHQTNIESETGPFVDSYPLYRSIFHASLSASGLTVPLPGAFMKQLSPLQEQHLTPSASVYQGDPRRQFVVFGTYTVFQ